MNKKLGLVIFFLITVSSITYYFINSDSDKPDVTFERKLEKFVPKQKIVGGQMKQFVSKKNPNINNIIPKIPRRDISNSKVEFNMVGDFSLAKGVSIADIKDVKKEDIISSLGGGLVVVKGKSKYKDYYVIEEGDQYKPITRNLLIQGIDESISVDILNSYPHLSIGEKFSHLGLYKFDCSLKIEGCLESLTELKSAYPTIKVLPEYIFPRPVHQ